MLSGGEKNSSAVCYVQIGAHKQVGHVNQSSSWRIKEDIVLSLFLDMESAAVEELQMVIKAALSVTCISLHCHLLEVQ